MEKTELKYHHFASINVINDSNKYQEQMLELLGKRSLRNNVYAASRHGLITKEKKIWRNPAASAKPNNTV